MKNSFIFLAAGKSERMGQAKHSLQINGKSFAEHQAKQVVEAIKDTEIYFITRAEFKQPLKVYFQKQNHIQVIENPLPESQTYESVKIALQTVMDSAKHHAMGIFLCPIDTPIDSAALKELQKNILQATASQDMQSVAISFSPCYQNRHGHPIWISNKLAEEFLLQPERLDLFLKKYSRQSVPVNTELVISNINTLQEWQEFLQANSQ